MRVSSLFAKWRGHTPQAAHGHSECSFWVTGVTSAPKYPRVLGIHQKNGWMSFGEAQGCAVLYWVQRTQYGYASLTLVMMNEKVQLTKLAFVYVWFDEVKAFSRDLINLKENETLQKKQCQYLQCPGGGFTPACVLLCFYMDCLKKNLLQWLS